MLYQRLFACVLFFAVVASTPWAIAASSEEMADTRSWAVTKFRGDNNPNAPESDLHHFKPEPFFSFTYDGKPAADCLKTWKCERDHRPLDAQRTEHTIVYTDSTTGLVVRCVGIEYHDFPAVEWTVYFKNTGVKDTPILENIQGLDISLTRDNTSPSGNASAVDSESEFILNGIKGDFCKDDSYEPYRLELGPNVSKKFAPPFNSGKSCDGPDGWPYFNLQTPGGGIMLAVGWPAQWACTFARDAQKNLHIAAGQQLTHLVLKPKEEIRTPLIAMVFWRGTDVVQAQNLWRRWYLAHVIPHLEGKPQLQIQVSGMESSIHNVDQFLKAGIHPDICWRDACWYPHEDGPYKDKDVWLNTGTWIPNPKEFPNGFKPFSDWVHAHDMKFLLWFEPERAGDPNSWLAKNHPEWLLPGSSHGGILNEGNPEAKQWLIDHVDRMIKTQGLDWYREDMNGVGPAPAWRKNDAPDRQGITENFYVQGHLAFWDEIKRRNPHLCIDSCASGGRRNDLETMRRSVPLLRSDFQFPDMKNVVEGNQGHTYGLSSWLPFQGTGVYFYDTYSVRSFYLPGFGMGNLTPENTASQQKGYGECKKIAPAMLFGDYYPLTPYSLQHDQWIAWQFDRPEQGEGVIQAFRRPDCKDDSIAVKLRGLVPEATYILTNFDVEGTSEMTGQALLNGELRIPIKEAPGAAIVTYQKKP
jgi:alpha-galactosidase